MSLIPQIETVIKKLIIPQYPELTEFEVRDLFADENMELFLGYSYVVDFYTSECLSTKKQMEIDSEVKTLFKMLSPDKSHLVKLPEISCFFDCGDGEGFVFNAEYGYKH
jgi:hypothetical protein